MGREMLRAIVRPFKRAFFRDAFTLSSSAGLAQIVALVTTPVISRIFSPEDFGMFALYMAIFFVINMLTRLHLEELVVLPESDERAAAIVSGLLLLTTFSSLIIFVLLLLSSGFLATEVIKQPSLELWLFFLPISTFTMSSYIGLRFLLLRGREFRKIAFAFFFGTVVGSLVTICIGYLLPENHRVGGLVIGFVVQTSIFLLMARSALQPPLELIRRGKFRFIRASIWPYKRLVGSILLSRGVTQAYSRLPVFFISAIFGNPALGFYAMADRLASAPRKLISQAIGDVYRQRAAAAWNTDQRFDRVYLGTLLINTAVGVPMFTIAITFAPEIFSFVLGTKWEISGEYASILMVGGLFAFIATPLDKGVVIRKRHGYMVGWPVARLTLKLSAIAYCYWYGASIEVFLWLLVSIRILLHTVDLGCEYIWSKGLDVTDVLRDRSLITRTLMRRHTRPTYEGR